MRLRYSATAPTFLAIDHSLSLRTRIRRLVVAARLLRRFETYAACESGIARHANDMFFAAKHVAGRGHSKRSGKRGAGMAGAITIVLAFSTEKKAVETFILPDG